MFPRKRLNYNNEERCFLCGPCRDFISGTSLEVQLVKRSVGVWCEMAASLGVSWSDELAVGYSPAGKDVSRGHCVGSVTRKRLVKTYKTLCVLQLH
jgi:hypothetical protein